MRVFISSTSEDLGPYRSAAESVVLDLGWQPDGMEHFGAEGSLGIVEACAERVRQADLVLAIIAWRRGGVPGPERGGDGKTSYTKWEIDAAFRLKKPVLVLMASDTWPGKLWEDDAAARAWVKSFRGDLDRMAEIFESEQVEEGAKEPLPVFRAKVRQELLRHQEKVLREQRRDGEEAPPEPASAVSEPSLRTWLAPEWPERPYPLLLPYSHPALFAGRDRELAELRRLVLLPQPILCLHAASGAGKSSLLAAGLVPVLRAEGRPVAFERRPADPGLAGRLAGDLLEPGDDGLDLDDERPDTFVEHLLTAERLAGAPSLLVLDQFEDLMRPDAGSARARLGLLLAASVQRQPGREGPPCRWLLAYREDFHGKVSKWLRDVLADARALEPAVAENLPHDLSDADRSHAWPLPPLGTPPPGGDRIEEAASAFRQAIETPLSVAADGEEPRYRWRFAGDGAKRLARAFAEARDAQSDAPLVPELQVVLAHLLQQAGEPGDALAEIRVPEHLETVIDQALEDHLRCALDAVFTGRSTTAAREGRTQVLLALRELADAEGKRCESLLAEDLASAIGVDGADVLKALARRDTRLLVLIEQPGGPRYALSHDRLAEVVVRLVEEEGLHGGLDADLLALRRFVRLNTELFLSEEREQATRIPRGRFRRIAAHRDALIRGDDRERWWTACGQRRRADVRRLAVRSVVAAAAVVLIGLWTWSWVQKRSEQPELLRLFASGDVTRVLAGVDASRHNEEVLRAVEVALPRLQERFQDLKMMGTVAWTLDYFPGQDPLLAQRARVLRQKVLEPLRKLRPPPEIDSASDLEWAVIPAGSFQMGSAEGDGYDEERPRHEVTLTSFRMLAHEVTNEEYRRLVPDHGGDDNLPVVRVHWYEAYAYAAWLGGRLPAEAEWEYAARAGTTTRYWSGDEVEDLDRVGWYDDNSGARLHELGEKKERNPWGLHDVHGNAWEWVADWYGDYLTEPQIDPMGPPSGEFRVIRGGGCRDPARNARAASRLRYDPEYEVDYIGFRVVLPGAPSR